MKIIVLLSTVLSGLLPAAPAFTQKADSLRWSIEGGATQSYTGTGATVGIAMRKGRTAFYLGTKTTLTYLVRQAKMPIGCRMEMRNEMGRRKRFGYFFSLSYENIFLRLRSPDESSYYTYQAHEAYFGYGTALHVNRLMIGNSIAFGGYSEYRFEPYENTSRFIFYASPQVKLFIAYEL